MTVNMILNEAHVTLDTLDNSINSDKPLDMELLWHMHNLLDLVVSYQKLKEDDHGLSLDGDICSPGRRS